MIDLSSSAQNKFNADDFLIIDKLIEAASAPILHRALADLFNGEFETGVRLDENYFPVLWCEAGYRTPQIDDYLAGTVNT
jgi:hypothetical protein